mgnify:CR=1 FL=1
MKTNYTDIPSHQVLGGNIAWPDESSIIIAQILQLGKVVNELFCIELVYLLGLANNYI